jgi:hypothetical protein
MSIEETVVLGQIPGTDYQPGHALWFTLASCILLLWVMYELYTRVHSAAHKPSADYTPVSRPPVSFVEPYSMLSLDTPTISSDYFAPTEHSSRFIAWDYALGVQLQLFKQKTFIFTSFLRRKLGQTVHELAQSALFATVKQRLVSVRLPSRSFLIAQATWIIARLEQWEHTAETFIVKTSRQLWRECRRLSSSHDTE